jgi:hypothetical protein
LRNGKMTRLKKNLASIYFNLNPLSIFTPTSLK